MHRLLRYVATIGVWASMMMLISASMGRADALKYAEISQRIDTIGTLQQQLSAQINLANRIRMQLRTQQREYVDELNTIRENGKIDSFQLADRQPRIHFNLKLIGRLGAYIDMLDQRIDYFQQGKETLEFLRQEADDNLKMIETLNDMQIENLLVRIDSAVTELFEQSQKDLVEPIGAHPPTAPEQTWKSITAENALRPSRK